MDCRENCGACCIAPSISSPIPGMPDGKPPGVPCIHLRKDLGCGIYKHRPDVCRKFRAEELVCGKDRQEALDMLRSLEQGPRR